MNEMSEWVNCRRMMEDVEEGCWRIREEDLGSWRRKLEDVKRYLRILEDVRGCWRILKKDDGGCDGI